MDNQNVAIQDPNQVPPQPVQVPQQNENAGQFGTNVPQQGMGADVPVPQVGVGVPPVNQSQQWGGGQPVPPVQQYPAGNQTQQYPPGQYPVTQPHQPVSVGGGLSPEVPSTVAPEQGGVPEMAGDALKPAEQAAVEAPEKQGEQIQQAPKQQEAIKAPEKVPNQQKFENPFSKVYGYKASPQIATQSKKNKGKKVTGDVTQAKTWIVVLLGRLLSMYKGKS